MQAIQDQWQLFDQGTSGILITQQDVMMMRRMTVTILKSSEKDCPRLSTFLVLKQYAYCQDSGSGVLRLSWRVRLERDSQAFSIKIDYRSNILRRLKINDNPTYSDDMLYKDQ